VGRRGPGRIAAALRSSDGTGWCCTPRTCVRRGPCTPAAHTPTKGFKKSTRTCCWSASSNLPGDRVFVKPRRGVRRAEGCEAGRGGPRSEAVPERRPVGGRCGGGLGVGEAGPGTVVVGPKEGVGEFRAGRARGTNNRWMGLNRATRTHHIRILAVPGGGIARDGVRRRRPLGVGGRCGTAPCISVSQKKKEDDPLMPPFKPHPS